MYKQQYSTIRQCVRGIAGVARTTPIRPQALKPQILKPPSPQTLKPTTPQSLKPKGPQAHLPSNPQALKPQTLKFSSSKTLKSYIGYTNLKLLTPSLSTICMFHALRVFQEMLLQQRVNFKFQFWREQRCAQRGEIEGEKRNQLFLCFIHNFLIETCQLMKKKTRNLVRYMYTRHTFQSDHNIHKRLCGHCFWASDPSIDRFY